MTPELRSRLQNVTNLPSPPGVAAQVITLAQDPDLELGRVAEIVTCDPSLAARILRVANSPMYAQRRRCDNLRQALVVLGMNATVTLALGFSLLPVLRGSGEDSDRFDYLWRRALLSAVAARATAARLRTVDQEEMFLAALLQDIGVLAIDRIFPGFYSDCGECFEDHGRLQAYEKERLQSDHAEIGAWLLECWEIPAYLRDAVAASHTLDDSRSHDPTDVARRCIALSGAIADLWLRDGCADAEFLQVAERAQQSLDLDKQATGAIFEEVGSVIPETAALFDTHLLEPDEAQSIVERAREALTLLNLRSIQEASKLSQTAKQFRSRARELEEENQRDGLTGVASRRHVEQLLAKGFHHARRFGWPFSIAFLDLDHFKSVNDDHGHGVGDQVLREVARTLDSKLRSCDTVGRFGGEEFILLLPGADAPGASVVAERMLAALRALTHPLDDGTHIVVTTSIGLASLHGQPSFETVAEFVHAADKALYAAKAQGRNRAVASEDLDAGQIRSA